MKVTLLAEEDKTEVTLLAGDTFIVPKEIWHRQYSENGVKLIFITSLKGNQHSTKDNPNK